MRLTLITPSLDRVEWIGHAIDSLVAQKDADIEHIVVDGGSRDGTIELLKRRYPQSRRIIEKRGNLYDALNIGINHATGDIIGFLNTDDRLAESALAHIRQAFADHPETDMVCGGCRVSIRDSLVKQNGDRIFNDPTLQTLSVGHLISGPILTNGRFFRRDVFSRVGLFDSHWPIFADRQWLARCFLEGITGHGISDIVYVYGAHAGSLTFSGRRNQIHLDEPVLLAREGMKQAHSSGVEPPMGGPPMGGARGEFHMRGGHTLEGRTYALYRRWHGWACGYRCLHSIKTTPKRSLLKEIAKAFSTDFLWPVFFLYHALWHGVTLRKRRGRRVL